MIEAMEAVQVAVRYTGIKASGGLYTARYNGEKYHEDNILILLPHCLQNSGCNYDLSKSMDNCMKCGSCKMGEISALLAGSSLKAAVAKGGTAAREIVRLERPGIILAVACERELESGIRDVGSIPVVGILNERPFGPCSNTTVDMEKLKKGLEMICR
ncbi:MAG: DUF116 domain-containing protein [Bacillota bacterium]